MAANCERTFIAIKPDGVQRGLVGEIIKRFEQKGFRLVAMKFVHVSRGRNCRPGPALSFRCRSEPSDPPLFCAALFVRPDARPTLSSAAAAIGALPA